MIDCRYVSHEMWGEIVIDLSYSYSFCQLKIVLIISSARIDRSGHVRLTDYLQWVILSFRSV